MFALLPAGAVLGVVAELPAHAVSLLEPACLQGYGPRDVSKTALAAGQVQGFAPPFETIQALGTARKKGSEMKTTEWHGYWVACPWFCMGMGAK
jgi:hypothetical protein